MTDKPIYEIPDRGASEAEKGRWFSQAFAEGESVLQAQIAYKDIDLLEAIILGEEKSKERLSKYVSDVEVNRIQRQQEEIVATYSNIRPIAFFETDNPEFDDHCRILDKCVLSWYYNTRADQKIKEVLDYASCSTGYLFPYWHPDYYGPGEGEIDLKVLGPKQVRFVGLPADMDTQRADVTIVTEEWPLSKVRRAWRGADIKADRATPTWYGSVSQIVSKLASPLLRALDMRDRSVRSNLPTVDVHYCFIDDPAINAGKEPVQMGPWSEEGKPLANWSYEVPFLGQEIPTGYKVPTGQYDPSTGQAILVDATRPAQEKDCLLYPQKRLIIVAGGKVVYDDTSYFWHGVPPIVPFRLKTWPKQFLGLSPFKSNVKLQRSNNNLRRGVEDKYNVSLDPPLMADPDYVGSNDLKALNLRTGGQRLLVNMKGLAGDSPVKSLVDPSLLTVNGEIPQYIQQNEQAMDYHVALNDTTALFQQAQTPDIDTIEKSMGLIGPVATGRSHIMEASVMLFGRMVGSLMLQWYDRKRRTQLLGKAGLTKADFDEFDPDSMVPAKLGDPAMADANRVRRARYFQSQLKYRVVHGSLHELTQTSHKLTLLQMQRGGMMMPEGTVAHAFGQENFIKYPPELTTEAEKWGYEQEFKAQTMAKIQAGLQQLQAQNDPTQLLAQIAQAMQGTGGNPGAGRKPSGQRPPKLETRNDPKGGQRTLVSESK